MRASARPILVVAIGAVLVVIALVVDASMGEGDVNVGAAAAVFALVVVAAVSVARRPRH